MAQTRREKAKAGDPKPKAARVEKASPVDEFPPENVSLTESLAVYNCIVVRISNELVLPLPFIFATAS